MTWSRKVEPNLSSIHESQARAQCRKRQIALRLALLIAMSRMTGLRSLSTLVTRSSTSLGSV